MLRSLVGGLVLAGFACIGFVETANAGNYGRFQPMTFALTNEGPAEACSTMCRQFLAASGTITADASRQFLAFIRDNPVQDATVVLESDGGSVLGALELGRAIRRLGLSTTVGRMVERRPKAGAKYGEIRNQFEG
jgi:hypothetical protein